MPVLSFEPGAHHPDGLLVEQSIACSKPSDSGERCEVKIAMESRGGLPRCYFFELLFSSHRSPLSERLEQAKQSTSGRPTAAKIPTLH